MATLIRIAGSQLSRTSPARPEMSEAASKGARPAPPGVITSEAETSLTPREREVLELVRLGLGNRQVAAQLEISPAR